MNKQTETAPHFIFGDKVQMIAASNSNPRKNGIFVRRGVRKGIVNPGTYAEVTDGRGDFWETSFDNLVRTP